MMGEAVQAGKAAQAKVRTCDSLQWDQGVVRATGPWSGEKEP